MSRASVYEGLKNALKVRKLPYHHCKDDEFSILFQSWEQFGRFDRFLDSISTPDDIKLCIYAEQVNGRSDGVAVTVSDEVQHLGYMQSRLEMPAKIAAYEGLLSSLLRSGVDLLDYDYEIFTVTVMPDALEVTKRELESGGLPNLPYYISEGDGAWRTIHIEFAT